MKKKIIKITEKMLESYDDSVKEKYVGSYYIEELTFGEKQDVIELSSDYQTNEEGDVKFKINPTVYTLNQMLTCIRKAPSEVTEEYIREMPSSLGSYLNKVVRDINEEEDWDTEQGKE